MLSCLISSAFFLFLLFAGVHSENLKCKNSKCDRRADPGFGWRFGAVLILALGVSGWAALAAAATNGAPALKDVFHDDFRIGAALNDALVSGRNGRVVELVRTQFNAITPVNAMKWAVIHPRQGQYEFGPSDRFVAFGEANHMFIVGHTLVWHDQVPEWVFLDEQGLPVDREALLQRLRDHIVSVVGRYRGRVNGWDVVNEALNDDGSLRDTPWRRILGDDYIALAFEFVHQADSEAELYYNDYSLDNPAKRKGAVELIRRLQKRGIPIAAVGSQHHDTLDWPKLGEVESTFSAFAKLDVNVNITELDIDVLPAAKPNHGAEVNLHLEGQPGLNPYTNGLPESVERALAKRYADLFTVFHKHRRHISRVTFWGVTDADSWLNYWPIHGRTSYPLLFDRDGKPKPAFDAVVTTLRSK